MSGFCSTFSQLRPSVVVISEGKRHDVRVRRTLRLAPGTIVVMDRGYVDYAWFGRLTTDGVFFVTRLKDNACYRVIERRRVPERSQIQRDEVIRVTGAAAGTKCPHDLQRVTVYDPDTAETLVFVTNRLTFGATTIAAIYKDRWQVELFFKALKQNLKIKTFVGTSANALEFVHASPSVDVARSAVQGPADRAHGVAGGVGPWLIGTAGPANLISAPAPTPRDAAVLTQERHAEGHVRREHRAHPADGEDMNS